MQPIYQINGGGSDLTSGIADRLLEMTITDEAGIESDRLSLSVDNRDNGASLPGAGATIEAAISYKGHAWVPMGLWIVDEIEYSSPPATMSLTAKAADMTGAFRTPIIKSWHETTLGGIVSEIAAKHGYTPRIDPQVAGIEIEHIDQTEESDMSFLTRLSKIYDCVCKPCGGALVFAKHGNSATTSGQSLPSVGLVESQLTSWRYRANVRMPASKRVFWWDYKTGERKEAVAGSGPMETVRMVCATEKEAQSVAETHASEASRTSERFSFVMPGDPRLLAEGMVSVSVSAPVPGSWRIARAEHRISARGYTTSCECERP